MKRTLWHLLSFWFFIGCFLIIWGLLFPFFFFAKQWKAFKESLSGAWIFASIVFDEIVKYLEARRG